jgi:hypothetical protein
VNARPSAVERSESEAAALAEELAVIDALPDYLTREEVWTLLRVDERTVDRWLEKGVLARRRLAGRTLIPRASLRGWVLQQAGIPPGEADSDAPVSANFGGSQTPDRKDST